MTEQLQSQEIAVRVDQGQRLDGKQIAYIASTEFVPRGYRGNLPAIMACIQTGRELGLGDLEALRSINVIDGRPSLSAELMVKLARRAGHSIGGEYGDGLVKITGRRKDTGDEMTVTWTLEMAHRAGLVGKDNWKKYPEAMLWARAASQLCRMLFPDVLSGLSYTPDEVEMSTDERVGEALAGSVPVSPPPDDDAPIDGVVVEESGGGSVGTDGYRSPDAAVEADQAEAASPPAGAASRKRGASTSTTFADMVPPGARGES